MRARSCRVAAARAHHRAAHHPVLHAALGHRADAAGSRWCRARRRWWRRHSRHWWQRRQSRSVREACCRTPVPTPTSVACRSRRLSPKPFRTGPKPVEPTPTPVEPPPVPKPQATAPANAADGRVRSARRGRRQWRGRERGRGAGQWWRRRAREWGRAGEARTGPGTGGGNQANYPPQSRSSSSFRRSPLRRACAVQQFIAEFDVDSTGRVLDFHFTATRDGDYNKRIADVLRAMRFRPGTRPDGSPLRMKAQIGYEF